MNSAKAVAFRFSTDVNKTNYITKVILGYLDRKVRGDNHPLPTLEDDGSIVGGGLGEKWSGGYGEIGRR